MDFLLTSYIYPLSEQIILSTHLNFCLDNPRTDSDISAVKRYLIESYDSGQDIRLPVQSDENIITLEDILFKFRDLFSHSDEYVASFFRSYDRDMIFDFIARMWVIARFDDEGETQQILKEREEMLKAGQVGIIMLENEHPIVRNSEKLADYSYLLSLLSHTEGSDYFGRGFILTTRQSDRPIIDLWMNFFMFGVASRDNLRDSLKEPLRWIFLPHALDELHRVTRLLDKAFANGLEEKLLYIGSILKIVGHDVRDVKVSLVMLTSIIEMLLTHNPNFNRFNVEDSINKQFQLKASILIYLNNRNVDIYQIQKRLKTIYEQRSNVAHGNFGATNKYIRNLSKTEGEEEYFDDLIVDLYIYVRAILEQYLEDRSFVEFLKEN
jgi:hypothetical protein